MKDEIRQESAFLSSLIPHPSSLLRHNTSFPIRATQLMAHWQRTHTCGELRDTHVGQTVTLNGWVNTYRSYNNQVFVDLRDRYGLTQVVFESDDKALLELANSLGREFVVSVRGIVRARLPGKENIKLAT